MTLTVHDIMRLRGCSRATAYRIIAAGIEAKSLTIATEYVAGGNGARQKRRVVRAEAA